MNLKQNKKYKDVTPLFHSNDQKLARNIFIIGSVNSGKSYIIKQLIQHYYYQLTYIEKEMQIQKNILGQEAEVEIEKKITINPTIYYISALYVNGVFLDPQIQELADKGYNIQYFSQEDVDGSLLNDLYNDLLQKREEYDKIDKNIEYFNIVIFDDVYLNKNALITFKMFLRLMRHLRCVIIVSSQNFKTLLSVQFSELFTAYIIFKGLNNQRIKQIYEQILTTTNNLPFNTFLDIYNYGSQEKHQFLVIDKMEKPVFQKGFLEQINY